jgi:hypothetical protein
MLVAVSHAVVITACAVWPCSAADGWAQQLQPPQGDSVRAPDHAHSHEAAAEVRLDTGELLLEGVGISRLSTRLP